MKKSIKFNYLFIITVACFIVFFSAVTSIESYHTNQKKLLLVTGTNELTQEEAQRLKVNAVSYGIWKDEQEEFHTDHQYILVKMKSRKLLVSSNDIEDIIKYTNK
ncbi:hypothetical protein [Paenibacillus gorillae]|uniref:hypothetical protein n=1 Tax=Paenibacillus gorillae TaxID=1243662 RepID=UPI0005A87B72|nr:hypothetical protein [Paenibacillus gorillae]